MNATVRAPAETLDPSIACPEYPAHVESLLGVIREQLELFPDRVVCRSILRQRTGFVTEPLTVRALLERAGRAAATLRSAGVLENERVILSLSDPHEFIIAFFGSLIAGAIAVPLPSVVESGAPRSFAARVRAVCSDCAPRVAVVENAERFRRVAGELRLTIRTLRDLEATPAGQVLDVRDWPASQPAFIQYTSGSTGAPKGVVVTHGNILANCKAIRDATGYTRADRMVAWLPLHHDMGLVGGLLTSIYCAAETCLMPPLAFLGRPVTWLEAITHCEARLTVAPTFAYSLCARKIPDKQLENVDLSSLRLAYVGAEPIDPMTLHAFIERFTPYGLSPTATYPVYGLAEATLAVSFPAPGTRLRYDTVDRRRLATAGVAELATSAGPDCATFVSVGHALPRHRVTIVDRDTGDPLAERQVGELLVQGGSVTPRYFSDPPETTCPVLRTGDLAYVADGHLYIVDRIKDLVIIGGQNYAPSDIENAVAEVDGLRRGRIVAFSAPRSEGGEALHIVAEASPLRWRPPKEVEADVRNAVRGTIGLSAATVTIVAPGSLERTSSGKIKRRACAEAHRNGALEAIRTRSDLLRYRLTRRRNTLRFGIRRALQAVLASSSRLLRQM